MNQELSPFSTMFTIFGKLQEIDQRTIECISKQQTLIEQLTIERDEARKSARAILFGRDEHGHSVDTIEECYRRWGWLRHAEE